MERETATWKKDYVKSLNEVISSNPVIGIISVGGIPAPQLQKMRNELRGKMQLIVTKNNLLDRALREMGEKKKGLVDLCELIDGQSALVGSHDNPFKLNKIMEATMTPAPAKGGELAPDDIDIEAGETPFKPGPIVGDLQKAGIPAAIEGGKVMIKKSRTLVKAGEPIPVDTAKMLTKLDIFPLTVGMELRGVYEEGLVFTNDVLTIDDEKFMSDLNRAISGTFNLAHKIAYTTPATMNTLLLKAQSDAMSVAMFAGVTNKTTIDRLLGLASGKMMALASQVPDALDEDLKGRMGMGAAELPAPVEPEADEKKPDAKPEKEKKKKPEADEDEMAAGMGALLDSPS